MPLRCAVYGCHNESSPGGDISLHRFPPEPVIRQEWINFVSRGRQNFTVPAKGGWAALCSAHFPEEEFLRPRNLLGMQYEGKTLFVRVRLKPDAIPSINDGSDAAELDAEKAAKKLETPKTSKAGPSTPSKLKTKSAAKTAKTAKLKVKIATKSKSKSGSKKITPPKRKRKPKSKPLPSDSDATPDLGARGDGLFRIEGVNIKEEITDEFTTCPMCNCSCRGQKQNQTPSTSIPAPTKKRRKHVSVQTAWDYSAFELCS